MSESNALANGLAGAGGGIIAQIITYPLQTVRYPLSLLSLAFPSLVSHRNQFNFNFSGEHTPANRENSKEEQAKSSLLQHYFCSCPWHSSSDLSGSKFPVFLG
jgi:hypothetical protein